MFTELENLQDDLTRPPTSDLTHLDYVDWLEHPITQVMSQEVKAYLIQTMTQLAENQPHTDTSRAQETLMRGEVNMCKWLLNWQPEHLRDSDA